MKKRLCLCLCLIFVIALVGCGSDSKGDKKDKDVEKEAAKISDELTSGEIVIEGDVYKFPMALQDFLDNGWEISKSYDNIDDFELEPNYSSTEFEIWYEGDKGYVTVTVENTSDKPANVQDCQVDYLRVSSSEVDFVLPGGISKSDKPSDIFDLYGNPDSKDEEPEFIKATYKFSGEDSEQYTVKLGVIDNSYTNNPLSDVTYSVVRFDNYWDALVEKFGSEEAVEIFIDETMKVSFMGDYERYLEYAISTESEAIELYESEVTVFSSALAYYAYMNEELLTDEQKERLDAVSAEVLSKIEWDVQEVKIVGYGGTATIELSPTDFFFVIEDAVGECIDDYNEKYSEETLNNMTDEEYAETEVEYNEAVITALEELADEAGTLDPVVKEFDLDLKKAILTDDAWEELDDYIMNFTED